jgi:hypothetical protein
VPVGLREKYGTESLGFNPHAAARIEAHDRAGREKLCRYAREQMQRCAPRSARLR